MTAGDGWDLGVHASRLAEASERFVHPDADGFAGYRADHHDVRYAWVEGGGGIHDEDADPADETAEATGA